MLEGPDVSIEISLKEYGIAWKIGKTETRFYYGINHTGGEYTKFDWADLRNDVDLYIEFDWADLLEVANFVGVILKEWEKLPLACKIQDLVGYYGTDNIFGESNIGFLTYEEVITSENEPA